MKQKVEVKKTDQNTSYSNAETIAQDENKVDDTPQVEESEESEQSGDEPSDNEMDTTAESDSEKVPLVGRLSACLYDLLYVLCGHSKAIYHPLD